MAKLNWTKQNSEGFRYAESPLYNYKIGNMGIFLLTVEDKQHNIKTFEFAFNRLKNAKEVANLLENG